MYVCKSVCKNVCKRSTFYKKKGIHRTFFTSSFIEKKTKLARIVQLTSLRNRMAVANELFFFHVELWAKNTNPQHRHTPFAISKINFSEKLHITQKILHEYFETYG